VGYSPVATRARVTGSTAILACGSIPSLPAEAFHKE
jgi:hypothetical protein